MFKVPVYNFQNYQKIIEKTYSEHQQELNRIDFSEILNWLNNNFIKKYSQLDSRKLWSDIPTNTNNKIKLNNKEISEKEFIIAVKLLMPTIRKSEYFLWNEWVWSHWWIDIILPQWTPIPSFSEWKVVRIKQRDWIKKDEWNCVVIQSWKQFFCYEHLDKIYVENWQHISKSFVIWTCWKTWNSTQYHLHFQIDKDTASFHPYRSSQTLNIEKNTENPIPILHNIFNKREIFRDLPSEPEYKEAIIKLHQRNIIKWNENKILPNENFPRRQSALIINRIAQKFWIYDKLHISNPNYKKYSDMTINDPELDKALENLQKFGIINWQNSKFSPEKKLNWKERIAMLWRLFFGLKDSEQWNWYDPYLVYFQHHKIIANQRKYTDQELVRKEVFLITYKTMKHKWFF